MEDHLFGEGEPYFGPEKGPKNQMTFKEEEALMICLDDIVTTVDPVGLINQLKENCILPAELCDRLLFQQQRGVDASELCRKLFRLLPCTTNISSLVKALNQCGYTDYATKIYLTYLKLTRSPQSVNRYGVQQSRQIRDFSRKLKRNIHNTPFENRPMFFKTLASASVSKIQNMKTSSNCRGIVLAVDRTITILCAGIDTVSISFDASSVNNEMFPMMMSLIEESSNTDMNYTAYFGRRATALAIAGGFEESENMLVAARCHAFTPELNSECINLFYTEVIVRLWKYEKFPTEELKEAILFWSNVGLSSLSNEDEYATAIWRRNFIIRMTLCLLGLGNRTNVIHCCKVDGKDILEATKLLKEFERNNQGIETRRRMFFKVLKGRLYELRGYTKESLRYFKEGYSEAKKGNFDESYFIKEHVLRSRESLKMTSKYLLNATAVVRTTKYVQVQPEIGLPFCSELFRDVKPIKHCHNSNELYSKYNYPHSASAHSSFHSDFATKVSKNLLSMSSSLHDISDSSIKCSLCKSQTTHHSVHETISTIDLKSTHHVQVHAKVVFRSIFHEHQTGNESNDFFVGRRPSPVGCDSSPEPSFNYSKFPKSCASFLPCDGEERGMPSGDSMPAPPTVLTLQHQPHTSEETPPKQVFMTLENVDSFTSKETYPKLYADDKCIAIYDVSQSTLGVHLVLDNSLSNRDDPSVASYTSV